MNYGQLLDETSSLAFEHNVWLALLSICTSRKDDVKWSFSWPVFNGTHLGPQTSIVVLDSMSIQQAVSSIAIILGWCELVGYVCVLSV